MIYFDKQDENVVQETIEQLDQYDETQVYDEEEIVEPAQTELEAILTNSNANVVQTVEGAQFAPISLKQPGKANIVVLGVGGGGCNAVNNMHRAKVESATLVVMNTDAQALLVSGINPEHKIQIGVKRTGGLGAGSDPVVGQQAAEESREHIKAALKGIDLLFITAGMGGGTGTGAAPVVAEIAKELGIITVAVVTKPFNFEGPARMRNAEEGIKRLKNFVDTLLVIPNQKLLEVLDKDITVRRAFEIADDVLRQGVQGVSDVIVNPELINLDFADVRTILSKKGLAHMGIGYGKGEKRIIDAVRSAVFSPLLETDIEGATGIIINITGGEDLKLNEVDEACSLVKQVVDPSANIIVGTASLPEKQDIEITIIATGFMDKNSIPARSVGATPTPSSKPVAQAIASIEQAAADAEIEKKEIPQESVYSREEIFANRPVFGQRYTQEQPTQPVVAPKQEVQPQQDGIKSSRVDVSSRQVPAFLRRIKRDSDNQ